MPSASIDDIRYLIVFAKVAEMGSFSRAAQALGVGTPTVSQQVSRLEKRLGAALLYRNTRKLSLTADGARLLETAQAMLTLYEQGLVEFRDRADSARLRIAMPAILGGSPLMDVLGRFMREHADVRFHLYSSDSRNDLVGEAIDLAFRIGALADSGLRSRPVFALQRRLIAAPALLERYGDPRHPAELAELPWIGLTMRANERSFHHASGEHAHFRFTPRICVDSVEAAYRLAKQGLGLAAPPEFLVQQDPAGGSVVHVLPDWSLPPLSVHALWPSNLARTSLAHTLIRFVDEALASGEVGAER